MKKQELKEEQFKEKMNDACNMHMLKNVMYIKSRFSFTEGYMCMRHEIDKLEEELKTTIRVMQTHINEQDKLILELTEENKKLKDGIQG